MDKNKKIINKNKVVNYDPSQENVLNIFIEANKHIFPVMTINEDSNVYGIGYIEETNTLFIQYKMMFKSIEGFELGIRPESFAYFYHNINKDIYNKLCHSKNKAKFINDHIKVNYMYHREPIGLDLINLNN